MANWSSDVKRILVVGGGLIGIRHLQAVQSNPNCELVGLADPDMGIYARDGPISTLILRLCFYRAGRTVAIFKPIC